MSRATVRAAIQSYLDPANSGIPILGQVFAHPAKFTPEGDFYDNDSPGADNGAVIFIYIARTTSKRRALRGSAPGGKTRVHDVVLDCFIRSLAPQSETCGQAADTFLDALVTRIELDKTAGTSLYSGGTGTGTIFQWGEGQRPGEPDIDVTALYPRRLQGSSSGTQVYAQVRVTVIEQV